MKIVFFGTPFFSAYILEKLQKDLEISAVICPPDKESGRGRKIKACAVKQKADDLEIKKYNLENECIIIGGPNLQICDKDLGMICTLDMYGTGLNQKYVYHLITDKRTFNVNGVRYYDYNSCIDKFLDLENSRLIQSLI